MYRTFDFTTAACPHVFAFPVTHKSTNPCFFIPVFKSAAKFGLPALMVGTTASFSYCNRECSFFRFFRINIP